MIRFGLRLTLTGGREALARLILITVAVALGTGLLLGTLSAIHGVNQQNTRFAWLETGLMTPPASAAPEITGSKAVWWRLSADHFHGKTIGRVDLAAAGPGAPIPPGIPKLPGGGEYYASPSLAALIHANPAAQLGDRFPGRQVGTIGPAALPAPDALIIVVGQPADQLRHAAHVRLITSIWRTAPPGDCSNCSGIGINADGLKFVLAVGVMALFFPVMIFIGGATRLSAARREQRFAAMRLVGATPRQITVLAAVESVVAAVAGMAVGFGLFFVFRPTLAAVPFTGAPFYPHDLSLDLADILLVSFGVPIGAVVASLLALRRVRISPLGVARRVTPRPPRAWRVIPLLAGIAELSYVAIRIGKPPTMDEQIAVLLPGFVLIMVGLVVAGPWLTMIGSRVMLRRTGHPAVLIAGRRLADNPQAAFRAISGLVLALFVTAAAIGTVTTFIAHRGVERGGQVAAETITHQFGNLSAAGEQKGMPEERVSAAVLAHLRAIKGVQDVTLVRANPLPSATAMANGGVTSGLVSCVDLARAPVLGRCAAGGSGQVAAITPEVFGAQVGTVWPAAAIDPGRLQSLPVWTIVVGTDGSAQAVEQARSTLETAYPGRQPFPMTINEVTSKAQRTVDEWQQLTTVVILTSLPIAGCSLAVSVAAGLAERKRPFSLLRLAGVQLGVLRRVVLLESAVPLLVVAIIATATGFLAADLFLTAQLGYSLTAPGIEYYVVVGLGLLASLGIIASTFPLLRRITGAEVARNE